MNITTIGIDLAKSVFHLHGIDSYGKVLIKKQIKRAQMAEYFVNMSRWITQLTKPKHSLAIIKHVAIP